MIRERRDLPGTVLLAAACSIWLFTAPTHLAAQDLNTVAELSGPPILAPVSTTAPENAPAEALFDSSAVDSDDSPVSREEKQAEWDKGPDAWQVIIYPIFVWAPVLGADVKLPSIPSGPGGGGGGGGGSIIPEGTTSGNFNGAAFAGAEVLKSKWSMTANVLYAGMSGDRTSPKAHVGLNVIFGGIMVGHQLLLDGLSLEGGFRRIALNINATVLDYPEVSRKPGVWDPLIGTTYRRQLSKKWRLLGHFDGGGFGVGCDYDLVEGARAEWRFAKHFDMAMGLAALQFKITNTVLDNTRVKKTLTLAQTTYGPEFGFGIYF
jgi:hypothetical protein